jgi:hypothetical protein
MPGISATHENTLDGQALRNQVIEISSVIMSSPSDPQPKLKDTSHRQTSYMFSDLVSVGLTVCAEPLRITAKRQTCLFWYHLR